jgi:prepilin-type N-terminal cleavage/methylation domain-containing protein
MGNMNASRSAFTLVELAIVLVIVGLLVGGVLAGQELISQARMRSAVSQITSYKQAYTTFRTKYNCIAGDCSTIRNFFGATTQPDRVTAGNGNGTIEASNTGNLNGWDLTEYLNVFDHLAASKLITFSQYDETPWVVANNETGIMWPASKFEARGAAKAGNPAITRASDSPGIVIGNQVAVGYIPGGNVMHIGVCKYRQWGGFYLAGECGLNPWEGFHLDTKMDDGLPTSGQVIVVPSGFYMTPGNGFSTGLPFCTTATYNSTTGEITAPGIYRSEETLPSASYMRTCMMQIDMEF